MKYLILMLALPMIAFLLFSCKSEDRPLPVVSELDLDKYLGKWYEIARLPNSFEKGLICCSAEYSLRDDGKIKVLNKGRKETDLSKLKVAEGKAWVPNPDEPAKLKVSFFWIFAADYWVIDLAPDYSWAVVGHPNRKYFWLLSRSKTMPRELVNEIFARAEKLGFNIAEVIMVSQECEN